MPPYLAKSCRETELRWSPPKRTPNLLSAKAANTLLWSAVILKELTDNPYLSLSDMPTG